MNISLWGGGYKNDGGNGSLLGTAVQIGFEEFKNYGTPRISSETRSKNITVRCWKRIA